MIESIQDLIFCISKCRTQCEYHVANAPTGTAIVIDYKGKGECPLESKTKKHNN